MISVRASLRSSSAMERRYLQWSTDVDNPSPSLHPPGGQVQVVHDVVEAIEHEDDGGGEGGDVPPVDGDLLLPPPVPGLGRVLHDHRVQLLHLLLPGGATSAGARGQHDPVQHGVTSHSIISSLQALHVPSSDPPVRGLVGKLCR